MYDPREARPLTVRPWRELLSWQAILMRPPGAYSSKGPWPPGVVKTPLPVTAGATNRIAPPLPALPGAPDDRTVPLTVILVLEATKTAPPPPPPPELVVPAP